MIRTGAAIRVAHFHLWIGFLAVSVVLISDIVAFFISGVAGIVLRDVFYCRILA